MTDHALDIVAERMIVDESFILLMDTGGTLGIQSKVCVYALRLCYLYEGNSILE